MEIVKRLFVKLPLNILHIALTFTVIVPISYWIITGDNWLDADDLWDDL